MLWLKILDYMHFTGVSKSWKYLLSQFNITGNLRTVCLNELLCMYTDVLSVAYMANMI